MNQRSENSNFNRRPADERELQELLQQAGPRPAVPEADLTVIKAAAREEWGRMVLAEKERGRWGNYRGVLALAASVVLALVASWWWAVRTTPSPGEVLARVALLTGETFAEGAEGRLALGVGSELLAGVRLETVGRDSESPSGLALHLAGGQSLRLDGDTKVRLLSSDRLELQRGAVYVDSDSEGPANGGVEILTPYGSVRDVGTQFEVRLAELESGVRVRVREGRVMLHSGEDSYSALGGEELKIQRDGSVTRGRVDRYGAHWGWVLATAPAPEIEGRTLKFFLEWVSRESGWRLDYEKLDLELLAAEIRLHGSIDGLTPAESLSVVFLGLGSRPSYTIDDGVLRVLASELETDT